MDEGSTGVYDVTLTGTLGPEGGEQQPITLSGSMSGAGGGSGGGGRLLGVVSLVVRLLEELVRGADQATLRNTLAEVTDQLTAGAGEGAAAHAPAPKHGAAQEPPRSATGRILAPQQGRAGGAAPGGGRHQR